MSSTYIREIQGDEMLDIVYMMGSYSFGASPPLPDKTKWTQQMKKRKGPTYYALFDRETPAAIAASTRMTQQVRGSIYPMGGVLDVITHPNHRYLGYARRLMYHLLAADRGREYPFSCLYPFQETFYQRLGYVTLPQACRVIFDPAVLAHLAKMDLEGEVELLLSGEGYDTYRDFMLKLQRRIHGMALFAEEQRESAQEDRNWIAIAKVDGEVVGVMVYAIKGDFVTEFTFRADRFYYTAQQGKYLLLAWIARHIGQANQVEISLPSYETPETWLADIRPKLKPIFFAPMGRVLDVAGLGGMETGPGDFSAYIRDQLCPWNQSVWRFETLDGRLQVSPGQEADCELEIQGLSALVYGTQEPAEFELRGWGEPGVDVQQVMKAMFPPMIPHHHEYY
jgi:predicted acetyltransferase